ncbi:MAG TPA: SRPBCC family protein [Acidimicrobiales bacterium]
MADGKFEVHIDRTPDDVWAAIGDFGGIASWMPGIDSCTVEDDVRTLQTMGMELQEKLMGHDDATRTTSYSLIKGPMPIEHHLATISVEPDGDGSKLTWAYEVKPDEMGAAFGPVYEGSVKAVKEQLEG